MSYPALDSPAPDFTAPVVGGDYAEGATVSLSELKGESVVLYFYPKDDTPGCTVQACGLRDAWGELGKKARVFGVSVDPVEDHRKFIAKFGLPFPLLSDTENAMVTAYGVWVEKNNYGKKYMGTERTTFVIGPDGTVRAVFPTVKPEEHVDALLGVL